MSVVAEVAAPQHPRPLARAVVAGEDRPDRRDHRADVSRVPGVGRDRRCERSRRSASRGPIAVWNSALRPPRRLPGVAPHREGRGGHGARLHALRGLLDVRRPPRRVVRPVPALDDLDRDDGCRRARRLRGSAAFAQRSITLVAFATFALTGLWEESMQTLSLMLVAVGLSLLIGIPLGIVAGPLATASRRRSRRSSTRCRSSPRSPT